MCNRQISLASLCFVMFLVTLAVNYLSTSGTFGTPTQSDLSDKYSLPITPPGYVFSVWGLIYLWQLLWQLYLLFHSIKFSQELQEKNIVTFGVLFYVSWIVSCVFNMAWIVVFSFEYIALSSLVLVLITVTLYFNAYVNHKYMVKLKKYSHYFQAQGSYTQDTQFTSGSFPVYLSTSKTRRVLYRTLINNGVAFYAGWCSVAMCLNFGLFLAYSCDVDIGYSSVASLLILAGILLVYLYLDFYALRTWLMYTYSPYLILLWALTGILTKSGTNDGDLKGASRILVLALLTITGVAFVGKIIFGIIYRNKNKDNKESEEGSKVAYFCLH